MAMFELIVLLAFSYVTGVPQELTRCFTGGSVVRQHWSKNAISELCLKDDVSIIKSEIEYKKNETGTFALSKIYRKWITTDWEKCQPQKSTGGHISVLEVRHDLTLASATYICGNPCTINVDREMAQVHLQTEGVNHFEISGTTIKSGWFKTTTYITLDQTCEHLKVSCGKQSVQFHACFKQHMACVRFLHRTILPGNMANSICQNIEIIILLALTLSIFILLCILTKTYICYILLPIFIPISYIYGYFYNRSCKKCSQCGLVYHPFTECGRNCVCGARYDTSERMKLHRLSGLCPGYKSLKAARVLCKSKGSASILSILISLLILTFVTPINGLMLKDTDITNLKIDTLPDDMLELIHNVDYLKLILEINITIFGFILIIILFMLLMFYRYQHIFISIYVIDCKECNMYHSKSGLRYNGDFTNKCMTCTCGEVDDMEGLNKHKKRYNCLIKYKTTILQHFFLSILVCLILKESVLFAAAQSEEIIKCLEQESLTSKCTGPLLKTPQCTEQQKNLLFIEIAKQMEKDNIITSLDNALIAKLPNEIAGSMAILDTKKYYHEQITLEYAILSKYCDYYKKYEGNTGYSQTTWRTYLRSQDLEICLILPYQFFCRCFKSGTGCIDTKMEIKSTMDTYYSSHQTKFDSDLNYMLHVIHLAFRGSATSYIAKCLIEKNYTETISYLTKIQEKYPNNQLLKVAIFFTNHLLNQSLVENFEVSTEWSRYKHSTAQPEHEWKKGSELKMLDPNKLKTGPAIQTCLHIKDLHCISPRSRAPTSGIITCGLNDQACVYRKPDKKIYASHMTQHGFCVMDGHCLKPFEPISGEMLQIIKKSKCWTEDIEDLITEGQDKGRISCQPIDVGNCNVSGNLWTITLCSDKKFYYTDNKHVHDNSKDIGYYCMEENCKIPRFPIHPDFVKDCEWDLNHIKIDHLKQINIEDINSYKKILTEKLTTALNSFKYKGNENLPHSIPKYKYITIQGTQTIDGIENAFIEVEIPALSGSATGFKISSRDGIELFDAILYVKQASFSSVYKKLYVTGPTIGINTKHDERCTGACPMTLPHSYGWLTFSKERTSQWGCEEYGCLAISDGCVFGSCQDIIKDDLTIYRKETEELSLAEICITFMHNTFCTSIDSTTPTITDILEAQFKTVESFKLPNTVGLKMHKLYIGTINDIGVYKKACGNVQKYNNTILGSGSPKFDYVCHLAKRKDVILRKCFDNDYNSCKLLKVANDLRIEEDGEKLKVINYKKVMGTLKFKAIFGDIKYKSFTQDVDIDAEATCVGCLNCFENINCEIKVQSPLETTCEVESSCDLFTTRILFHQDIHKYALKLICSKEASSKFWIRFCNKEIKSSISLINAAPILELAPIDQTSYVKEEDERCGTWMCRVAQEGIGVIFEPFKNLFGSYLGIFYIIIIVIILLVLFVYIFLPMILKLKEILQKNEVAYQRDMKIR
ncbi:glycoprotein precursor [Orthobunyavirus bwambaense]|uniref:Envelopment polyprotein n=1 Tax=Orthobunyavirus bwambaense TaxID=3052384 RepID=A0A088MFB9_9VIRU|nr:glycoprotein precursor [Orthobunyavirus bwambaense]AIN37028.1 glycoprotein precursor [Orthobunyavirus bwambaense]